MATKSDFSAEERGKLLSSPMIAGMAITQRGLLPATSAAVIAHLAIK